MFWSCNPNYFSQGNNILTPTYIQSRQNVYYAQIQQINATSSLIKSIAALHRMGKLYCLNLIIFFNQSSIIEIMPKYDASDLLSDQDKPDYHEIMKNKQEQSKLLLAQKYSRQSCEIMATYIKRIMNYKEDKIFTMYAAEPIDFFNTQWNFISQRLPTLPFNFKNIVMSLAQQRVSNIIRDLDDQILLIEEPKSIQLYNYEIEDKNGKMYLLKGQSEQIRRKLQVINSSLQNINQGQDMKNHNNSDTRDIFAHLYTEEKKKEVEAFIKQKKQEKEQRRKKLQAQKLRQEQELAQKEKQMKEIELNEQKMKKQQFLKKNIQLHQKRNQEKAERQKKSEQYEKHIKDLNQKPRLFELLQKNYEKRVQYEQMERKHKMMSQKKQRYLNIDELKIGDHEKNYEQLKQKRAEERQRRYQEQLQELNKNQIRHHSSFELTREIDKQLIEKQRAKQKFQKIKHYQSIVKEKFKPKVDEDKKKQMMTLIEQLELNSRRKLKKTKLQNGSIVYEEIKEANPRALGIMYLQKTKQMAARAKLQRGSSASVEVQSSQPIKKKRIDYLQQLRKSPKTRQARRLSLADRPNMSFDEKVNKVLIQSQKLNDFVKQNQMKLKFGKFKTSQEILICKEQIDRSYLDIAKMKLKLIKQ